MNCGFITLSNLSPQGFMKRKGFYAKESATIPNHFRHFRRE